MWRSGLRGKSGRWKTRERERVEFRAEASNFRNHPIFNPPNTTYGSGSFGQVRGTKIGARAVQLSLKYCGLPDVGQLPLCGRHDASAPCQAP